MKVTLGLTAAAVGVAAMANAGAGAGRAVPAVAGLSHRPLCAERHSVRQWRRRLLDAAQRARRRHQRRQASGRGMRDRLRHRQGRRMLRASQEQGPNRRRLLLAALDRHHLRADREGAGRQDPAADHGLRPLGKPQRRGVRLELPGDRQLLDRGRRRDPAHRQGAWRLRQAQGQEDQPRLSRQPLRQGADPGARRARQEGRLHLQGDPGHPSGRRAEVAVAGDPPGPARLRAALGLGRDELHRGQGSGGRRLSARQDHRRVVVGRRAGRDARPATSPPATRR